MVSVQIAGECFYCLMILAEVVVSISQNTVHFGGMFVVRIGRQVILCYNLCLIVVLLDGINLCYIIRYECFVFGIVLQGEEIFQCLVITFLSVTDVSKIVAAILCIFGTAGTQCFKPDGGFFQIIGLHVAGCQLVGAVVTFFITQQIEAGRVEES